MNRDILEAIDAVIEQSKKAELTEVFNEISRHYLIQGLEISKQLISQIEEINTEEIAYEKFDELVGIYKKILPAEEFEEIINDYLKEGEDE